MNISSFNLQSPRFPLRSSSRCLRLLPRLTVTSILPYIFPSITFSTIGRSCNFDPQNFEGLILLLCSYINSSIVYVPSPVLLEKSLFAIKPIFRRKTLTISVAGTGKVPVETIPVRLGNAPSVTCSANVSMRGKSELFRAAMSARTRQEIELILLPRRTKLSVSYERLVTSTKLRGVISQKATCLNLYFGTS
jgi:hypothetical protein